jgi:hypothetical protein
MMRKPEPLTIRKVFKTFHLIAKVFYCQFWRSLIFIKCFSRFEDLDYLSVRLLVFVIKTQEPFSVRFGDTQSRLEVYLIFNYTVCIRIM